MMTAVQGIIAAGTVAYLAREATWEKMAFASNNLFHLVGIAAGAASVEIPHFSFAAKVVFCLTPVVLIEHFRQGQVSTSWARSIGQYFNRFYYAAAVVSTLVLVALGHTTFGIGFFSVMALDMLSRRERVNAYVKTAFEWSATVTALLTFASYAAKLATPRGQYIITLVGVQAVLPRICIIIRDIFSGLTGPANSADAGVFYPLPDPANSADDNAEPPFEGKPILPWGDQWQMRFTRYMMMPVGFVSSQPVVRSNPSAFMQGLQGLTGKLPHDL